MPKASSAKTKSVPRLAPRYLLVAVGIIFIGLLIAFGVAKYDQPDQLLKVNNKTYHLLVASTPTEQTKGLADRASLPPNEGMLFVFTKPAVQCFWMKDMHFSIDMVWVNTQKHIVHIQPNVSPSTYPEIFCPNTLAQYVLELNAGQVQTASLQTGQKLNF